ncbi:fumarylacetoacetate hydrolase family protein [Rhodococcus oxybenzonivorans]|uniref:fumarylacetoacetate hydrolase family protein n=1 Tax=Rhodococcus oxybenzonivorans TaxID=1990687 RepID=UPI0029551791|nr:fumarylacetoacetate hydrolase family protein [Rhodococcus oxybenzonivorans]MDV7353713.1 fumarylacetoacetate hydrolase family protein [Rhodococcus oxybenzonivorans]
MRVANQAGRLQVVADGIAVDVETASGGRFSAEPQQIFDRWGEFTSWAATVDFTDGTPVVESELGAPVPRPGQVFAIGVNYADHVEESGLTLPDAPFVFTKFPASITGPYDTIEHPGGSVDFEVELVAVIGKEARHVPVSEGWDYVAGLTLGQDLSERDLQLSGPPPQQFGLGKSFAGFSPIGPVLVTPDEFENPDDIEVSTVLSGELMQKSRTRHLIFPIPVLVSYLSSILPLRPGDLIFTGTPSGIGFTRDPKRLIGVDDELVSRADTIGEMRHRFTAATRPHPLTTVSRSTSHV